MNNGLFSYPRGSLKELLDINTSTQTTATESSNNQSSAWANYEVYLPQHTEINIPDHVDEIRVLVFGSGGNVASIGASNVNGAGGGGFVASSVDTTITKSFTCSISLTGSTPTIFSSFLAAYGGLSSAGGSSAALNPAYDVVQFDGGAGGFGFSPYGSGGGGGGGSPYGQGGVGGRAGGAGGGFGGAGGEYAGAGGGSVFDGGSTVINDTFGAGGSGTEGAGRYRTNIGGNGHDKDQDVYLSLLYKKLSGKGGDGMSNTSRGLNGGVGGGGGGGRDGGAGGFGGGGGAGMSGAGGAGGFGGGAGGTVSSNTIARANGIGGGGTGEFYGGSGCIVVYWR